MENLIFQVAPGAIHGYAALRAPALRAPEKLNSPSKLSLLLLPSLMVFSLFFLSVSQSYLGFDLYRVYS